MKFKVGDKVIGNKKASDCYNITQEGWTGTVKAVIQDFITVDGKGSCGGNGFDVLSECFDLVDSSQSIIIYQKGREVISNIKEGKKVVKSAKARCNPSDEFDFEIGAKLAFKRLMGEEEKKVLEVHRPAEVGEWIKLIYPKYSFGAIGDVLPVSYDGGHYVKVLSENHPQRNCVDAKKDWSYCPDDYNVLENYQPEYKPKTIEDYTTEELLTEIKQRMK